MPSHTFARSALRSVTAALVAFTVTAGALTLIAPPAQAATATAAWDSTGATTSDSAVTVRWDNEGNPADSVVERNATQVIPHTGGKTYDDLSQKVKDGYESLFGTNNSRGGLEATVSQTQNLVNQSVTVSFSGAQGGDPIAGQPIPTWFEVFQCWGAVGADGMPNPAATSPDPESCQVGVGGPDVDGSSPNFRQANGDRLLVGGDLPQSKVVPFRAIDGTVTGTDTPTPFNRTTTNEFSSFPVSPGGTGTRSFEMQTGSESSSLGCGYRSDAPSTSSCWLVMVPINWTAAQDTGLYAPTPSGLAPSLWAQRLQVKLGFQDVAPTCPSGQAQTLTGGSEALTIAMASWIPGACAASGVALGFSQFSDYQARLQLSSGASKIAFGSQPVNGTTDLHYAPAALSGIVVSTNISYQPCGADGPTVADDAIVKLCDYPDLATAQAEMDKTGIPLTNVKLNARLIAKLLTQSYHWRSGTGDQSSTKAPWIWDQPGSLYDDAEFKALNPTLRWANGSHVSALYQLNVESLRSDAAHQLWQWLASDPSSRSFLHGCPDANGVVINPFYSTRSYEECRNDATALEKTAAAKRENTGSPVSFDKSQIPSYPPSALVYPQTLWYEQDAYELAGVGNGTVARATMVDLFPPLSTMADTARSGFKGAPPTSAWCYLGNNSPCSTTRPEGEWKPVVIPQPFNQREVITITTTADAARFQLPTALLCDDSGANCVGADEGSLQKALDSGFAADATTGMLLPTDSKDYAGGAYPLAMLVYGVVSTTGLKQADATSLAAGLEYIAGPGQSPGVASGSLPPGYAPLSEPLRAQTASVVQTLRAVTDTKLVVAPPVTAKPPSVPASGVVPITRPAPAPQSAQTAPIVPAQAISAVAMGQTGMTGPTESGFPQLGLIGGLIAGLGAGVVSPFFGRRKKVSQ